MTINDILNEMNIELGNGQALAVTNAVKQRTSYDKIGGKDEDYTKTADVNTRRVATKGSVAAVIEYLKKKNLLDKVASKQDYETTDLVFKADGSCRVNFDDGGGINIPAEVLTIKKPEQQKTFIQKFKEKIMSSTVTEDVIEEDLKTVWEYKIKPILLGSALFASVLGGLGLSTKMLIKNVKECAKTLHELSTREGTVYDMKVGDKDIKYDEANNTLTIDGKTEKVKNITMPDFQDPPPVEFKKETVGSDTLQTLKPAELKANTNPGKPNVTQAEKPKEVATAKNIQIKESANYFPY